MNMYGLQRCREISATFAMSRRAISATEATISYWEMGAVTSPISFGFLKVDKVELIDDMMGRELRSDASISQGN